LWTGVSREWLFTTLCFVGSFGELEPHRDTYRAGAEALGDWLTKSYGGEEVPRHRREVPPGGGRPR